MKLIIRVKMKITDNNTLESVFQSIEPDNINFPKSLKFNMKKTERDLLIEIDSYEFNMTFLSTIDEILESAQVSIDTLKELR